MNERPSVPMQLALVEAQRLVGLLTDPHPGLITWCAAVTDGLERLNEALSPHPLRAERPTQAPPVTPAHYWGEVPEGFWK